MHYISTGLVLSFYFNRSVSFHYTSAVVIGIVASVLVLVYIVSKLVPGVGVANVALIDVHHITETNGSFSIGRWLGNGGMGVLRDQNQSIPCDHIIPSLHHNLCHNSGCD